MTPKTRRFETFEKALDEKNKEQENNTQCNDTQEEMKPCSGFLDIIQANSYGFLRQNMTRNQESDIYISPALIKQNKLRIGDYVTGVKRCKMGNDRFDALLSVSTVNGMSAEEAKQRIEFEKLIPVYPTEQIILSTDRNLLSTRIIDMFTPIGKGQRGLIVAPPKSGKTMLLKDIANGISTNHKEITLIVLLIGERPEEVTDMQRSVQGEVIASTFDESAERQTRIATFALERAKRLVEHGKDVVILMDSLTRLAMAYNMITPASGKILSGGIEMNSLYYPKKFFGAARNTERSINGPQEHDGMCEIDAATPDPSSLQIKNCQKGQKGGSLTIIATVLVDTGSKMDDVIFEYLKGTGNMELKLDRNLANRRIFPAIDILTSSTRRDDLLIEESIFNRIGLLRKILADESSQMVTTIEELLRRIGNTRTNTEFLFNLNS